MPFIGLAPVRLVRPDMAVLYHVNGKRSIHGVCYRFDFLANVLDLLFSMDYRLRQKDLFVNMKKDLNIHITPY